ncbi:hypothetical protein GGU10DRAFT_255402, partial [Lentinula aff. detonsa]
CRRCLLPINDIHNLNPESWVMRDSLKHRELAFESKDASPERRDAIYKAHGVRWTELLELPYWDPILFTVIDDMHLGYLGLFETHLRKIWGINHEKKGGDGLEPMPDAKKISKGSLQHRDSTLKQKSIRDVIGKDLLEQIWADMERTVLPSWIQKAPPKWGIPASGKLSADEYKVICSIHLVITLIRVWGYENEEGPQSRRFQMLLNFLDLVHSIHVLFLRETSAKLRAYYKT